MRVKYTELFAIARANKPDIRVLMNEYNAQTARNRRKIELSNKVVSLATFMNARRIK